jgi:hypothetical protein
MPLTFEQKKELINIIKEDIAENGSSSLSKKLGEYYKENALKDIATKDLYDLKGMLTDGDEYFVEFNNDGSKLVYRNPNYKLNESIKATNNSLIAANQSAIELNNKTDGYYKQLKIATWFIAIATIISALATIVNIAVTISQSHKSQNNIQQSHTHLMQQKDTSLKMQTKNLLKNSN